MIPMSYLTAAVSFFIILILSKTGITGTSLRGRKLLFYWMFYLGITSFLELITIIQGIFFYRDIPWDLVKTEKFTNLLFLLLSISLLMVTFLSYTNTALLRWLLFTACAIFIKNLLPVAIWNPMPPLVYRYFGVFALPMLFGMLMIAITIIQLKYRLQATS